MNNIYNSDIQNDQAWMDRILTPKKYFRLGYFYRLVFGWILFIIKLSVKHNTSNPQDVLQKIFWKPIIWKPKWHASVFMCINVTILNVSFFMWPTIYFFCGIHFLFVHLSCMHESRTTTTTKVYSRAQNQFVYLSWNIPLVIALKQ